MNNKLAEHLLYKNLKVKAEYINNINTSYVLLTI